MKIRFTTATSEVLFETDGIHDDVEIEKQTILVNREYSCGSYIFKTEQAAQAVFEQIWEQVKLTKERLPGVIMMNDYGHSSEIKKCSYCGKDCKCSSLAIDEPSYCSNMCVCKIKILLRDAEAKEKVDNKYKKFVSLRDSCNSLNHEEAAEEAYNNIQRNTYCNNCGEYLGVTRKGYLNFNICENNGSQYCKKCQKDYTWEPEKNHCEDKNCYYCNKEIKNISVYHRKHIDKQCCSYECLKKLKKSKFAKPSNL